MQWALRLDEDRKMKAHQKKSFHSLKDNSKEGLFIFLHKLKPDKFLAIRTICTKVFTSNRSSLK